MSTDELYIILWALAVPFVCACIVAVAVLIKAAQIEHQTRRARIDVHRRRRGF